MAVTNNIYVAGSYQTAAPLNFEGGNVIYANEVNAALRNCSIGTWGLYEALSIDDAAYTSDTVVVGNSAQNNTTFAEQVRQALIRFVQKNVPASTGTTLYKLTFNGTAAASGISVSKEFNGSTALSVTFKASDFDWQSGNIIALVGGSSSDERLKKNIVGWHYKKRISDLPVKEFDYKEDGKHAIGCIAQDLKEILPEAVFEHNGYLRIDEAKLIYPLIQEVRELREEVRALRELVGHSAD